MLIFQKRLQELRKQFNYTQRYMAEKLSIKQSSYFNYEAGLAEPTQENLVKIADIFDVTVDFLLGREN